MGTPSALSLRVFSEDVTEAGCQGTKKNKKIEQDEDMIEKTPVPEGPVHGEDIEGAESTHD